MGAKLEAMQPVGQNKHLKLRLGKGKYSFDAIYFSATRADCALEVGDRVDAAFYLQINEFRGSRTVQLQVVDLRASVLPSQRERESLRLCEIFLDGAALTPEEAARLLPGREQFVRLWQGLRQAAGEAELAGDRLPLLRQMAGWVGGAEPFARAELGLAVFAERGLLTLEETERHLRLVLCPKGKVVLEESCHLRRLRRLLGSDKGE